MKHLIFTVLLASCMLTAGAQNDKKMTKEEKEEALRALELYYRIEAGNIFDFGDSDPYKVETLPWEKWVQEYQKNKKEFTNLLKGFQGIRMEAVEDEPEVCRILLCCPDEGSGRSSMTSSMSIGDDLLTDKSGHTIGFHQRFLYGLETDIRLHLTDRKGRMVGIDTENSLSVTCGDRDTDNDGHEVYFGLQFPLTVPFAEVAGGHIDVTFYGPTEYEWAEIPTGETGKELSFCGVPFRIEKIDGEGFVISAEDADSDRFDELEYLYRRGGEWWEPSSTSSMSGDLKDMLVRKKTDKKLTFEEWMKKKGIDSDHLEETIGNFIDGPDGKDGDTEASRWGKRFDSGMTGDALLLYMPVDSAEVKPLVTARVFVPAVRKQAEVSVNETLKVRLLDRLSQAPVTGTPLPETSGNNVFTSAVAKFTFPDITGAPAELRSGCSLSVAERAALLAPNDIISYAIGVVLAGRLTEEERLKNLTAALYSPEEQQFLVQCFRKGIYTGKEILLQAGKRKGAEANGHPDSADDLSKSEAIKKAMATADSAGVVVGIAFRYGMEALQLYRSCAAPDMATADSVGVSGQRFNVDEAAQGLEDYLRRHLKMGVQYAASILSRRMPAVEDIGDRIPANGLNDDCTEYLPDFQIAYAVDPQTGNPEMFQTALSRAVRKPQEASELGLTGKVMAEAIIEADGSVNQVRIVSSPHKLLSDAVTDALYRMRCRPAMAGNRSVAMKLSIPVIFQ